MALGNILSYRLYGIQFDGFESVYATILWTTSSLQIKAETIKDKNEEKALAVLIKAHPEAAKAPQITWENGKIIGIK